MADQILNQTPDYTVTHVFSTDDVTGTFDGLTQGDVVDGIPPVVDFSADPKVSDGVNLYPVNSEFGFNVYDFDQAIAKDYYLDPEYEEGWVGDLHGEGGEQLGLMVSNTPTDTFKTPALLGTWLTGLGENTVKASTEHYSVMQDILSDQRYPGDPLAEYPLDDNLRVIGGEYDGQYVIDVMPQVGDVNGDGVVDIKDVLEPNEATIKENIAVSDDYSVTLKDDGKLLYRWGNAIKKPNDVRVEAELPLPDEWKDVDPEIGGLIPLFKVSMAELAVNHTITNNPNDQIRPEDFENESAIGTLPTYEELADGKWVSTDDYYAGDGTFYPAGTILKDPWLAEKAAGTALDLIGGLSSDLQSGLTKAYYTTMDREPFEGVLTPTGDDYVVGPRWRLQPDKYGQDLPSVVIPSDPSLPPPPTKDEVKYNVGDDTQTVINLLDWEANVSPLSISAGWQNNAGTVSGNGLNMTDNFDVAFYIKGDIKPATIYNTQLVMSYDEITIHDKSVAISGGEGDDYLVGQGGNTFTGDVGNDLFVLNYGVTNNFVELQTDTVTDFQKGNDTLGLIDLSVTALNFNDLVTQTVDPAGVHVFVSGFEVALLAGATEILTADDFLFVNRKVAEYIVGTDGNDYLVGDDFDNVIEGGDGEDTLLGLGGDDLLLGGLKADVLNGGDGDDTLRGQGGPDTLIGGDGIDTADYTGSKAVTVNLETGAAVGGAAKGDTFSEIENLFGSSNDDILIGDTGANKLSGAKGDDALGGGAGDDVLIGGNGADTLDGGAGDDLLTGAGGADTLIGGDDVDTASYSGSGAAVTVDLDAGTGTGGQAQGDTLTGIENVIGSKYADVLTGDALANELAGLGGDDILSGGDGDDVILGMAGADTMDGGAGIDTASYEGSRSGVQIDLLAGTASGGAANGDTLTGFENVTGSDHADALTGDAGANHLMGGLGDDTLDGGAGDDTLDGGDGADMFIFNAGNDSIDGGAGMDTAVFIGAQADFTVVDNGVGSWTVTEISSGDIDTLISVETLSFDDGYLMI